MVTMNDIIAYNIEIKMKENRKTAADFANALGLSKLSANKMLSGTRTISIAELNKIAEFLNTSFCELLKIPTDFADHNAVQSFMKKVNSDSARRALEIVDELADLIIFHAETRNNGEEKMKIWRM